MADRQKLNILYTNIGRGHPFYLDGICEEIQRNHSDKIDINITNVFDLSSGLSLSLWKLIRFMYHRGSQGGVIGIIYSVIRKNKKTDSYGFIEKILARGIRTFIKKNKYPTLVAHPMLIPMISDLTDVYYQHGEVSVPDMVVANDTKNIFVPSVEAKDLFCQKGIDENNITVTGLCIEDKLKENAAIMYERRIAHLNSNNDFVGAFFSSGAEPIGHVKKIIKMLISLEKNGQKAILFMKSGGKIEKIIKDTIKPVKYATETVGINVQAYFKDHNIMMIVHNGWDEENKFVDTLFEYFDYLVSPSHERTNWALGLGIPMFVLHPLIGPFSPINKDILIDNDVAKEILDDKMADNFGEYLKKLSTDGDLIRMAKNGFEKYSLDGFGQICKTIERQLADV